MGAKEDRWADDPVAVENRRRAEANRLKQVSASTRRREQLLEVSRRLREKKRREKRERSLGEDPKPLQQRERDPERRLEVLAVDAWLDGQVTRLVDHGAWVDVGAQVDGFVHISALSDGFVSSPYDALSVGENVNVRVDSVELSLHRLRLSMLERVVDEEEVVRQHGGERRVLEDISEEEQLWGIVTRVTHFGAFLDVGASREGFLHVSEYPLREMGQWAPDLFHRGQRLRAYVKEVDLELSRLKLTGDRPKSLPKIPWRLPLKTL